jgi:hypothetical protein
VTTMARSLVVLERHKEPVPFWPPTWSLTAFVLLFFCSLLVLQGRSGTRCLRRVLVFSSLIVIIAINTGGCGGGGGSGIGGTVVPPPTPQTGTAAGTYMVTVIANSTSLTHTMTLTLVVQ